ncbi:ParM/StbA family protein [Niallia sp. 03190]|uniref:ParM/StbA family protein n=1 Tax=Niallia sp. 03190 TaxID=3458061 RepID=UPI004043AF61
MTIVIGLDHGNGWVKVQSETGNFTFPSYFVNKADLGDDFIKSKYDLMEFQTNEDKDTTYLWGKDISKLNAKILIPTYGMQDRYKQERYKQLTKFALAAAVNGNADDILVVTGVPSSEKETKKEEDLKKAIEGTHVVIVNGEERIIKVKQVSILAQPIGTVLSQYLDKDGLVNNEEYENSIVGVIDIGSGTTDIDIVEDLRRQGSTPSLPEGISDVYQDIADFIKRENPNLNITRQVVEANFQDGTYQASKRMSIIDFSDAKKKAINKLANKIIQHVAQSWKTWDQFDEIIVTGGGATPLKEELSKLISDVKIVENSQEANAKGFFRYGQYIKGE